MESFELMDGEQTLPEQIELPHHAITPQRNVAIAAPFNTERGHITTRPSATAIDQPIPFPAEPQQKRVFPPRKRLERSSPQTRWREMIAELDAKAAENKRQLSDPSLPLNMQVASVTPRKRGLQEIYAPGEAPDQTNNPNVSVLICYYAAFLFL